MIKNLLAVIFYILHKIDDKTVSAKEVNILFINTEQLGDVIISSTLLNDDEYFKDYTNVYFLCDEKYSELFKYYTGKVKLIFINKVLFTKSKSYRKKFLKDINNFQIKTSYNISPARGNINEILTHSNACDSYAFKESFVFLGKIFEKYWNKKYKKLLFEGIENDYKCTIKLLEDYFNVSYTTSSFFEKYPSGNTSSATYIVISPYTTQRVKDWGIEKYTKIIQNYKEYKIYILHSPEQSDRLKMDFGSYENVITDYIPLYSIPSLLKSCLFYIGGDTGITHLANIMKVKSFIICGGGGYKKFFENSINDNMVLFYDKLNCFDCKWICKKEKPFCHYNVTAEDVIKSISIKFY